ncbi:MAG: FHA domain-containing protein [Deltaproteobacteria bacterium]|nr:FHA domain-containing protein [Deltaproteobacteria bacterium]
MTDTRTPVLATLQVTLPDGSRQAVSLKNGDSIRAGRDYDNDIVIDDDTVSRTHAQFDCSSFGVVVTDLTSRNGTFLNGVRLTSMRDLSSQDVVDIGPAKILFSLRSAEALQRNPTEPGSRTKTAQLKPVSVTVLVARVHTYREMLDQLGLPRVEAALNAWTNKLQDIIFRYGGRTDKTIEETTVALWVGEKPALQAERAAEVAKAIAAHNELAARTASGSNSIAWQASAVIATGGGLSGSVGAQQEVSRFTLVGDPVNFAFALEEEVKNFGKSILVDEQTAQALPAAFNARLLGHSTRLIQGNELPVFTIG